MRTLLICAGLTFSMTSAAIAANSASPPQGAAPLEFRYDPQGVYSLIAAPGRLTDIALEPGESLAASNAIAAGDTARWVIGDTTSGEGETRRVHVLVKPTAGDLSTNLVIYTTRRTYFLDLRASDRAFLTQIRWRYPQERQSSPPPVSPVAEPVKAPSPPPVLNFGYRVKGRARFAPSQVWDDGARTYVAFADSADLTDLPPLFLVGPDGKSLELVNYSVDHRVLILDRLFEHAELRLGLGRAAQRVRIERSDRSQGPVQ